MRSPPAISRANIASSRSGQGFRVVGDGKLEDSATALRSCNISNHFYGRAVDIGAVGREGQERQLVRPDNEVAEQLVNELGALATTDPLRPESLGSPWDDDVHEGHFTDGNHNNHLHIAWHTEPPTNFRATRAGLENPPQLDRITVPATGTFAASGTPIASAAIEKPRGVVGGS